MFYFSHGFVDVVHYMLKTAKLSHDYRDSHSRTLVFIAVMHAQHDVLRYLTQQVSGHNSDISYSVVSL